MLKYFVFIKNKLFKFTPFNVLILVLISIFVITIVKYHKVSSQKQLIRVEVVGKDWTNNYTQYNGYRPPYWLIEDLKIGAQEFSLDGRVVAEIKDIEYFERNTGNAQVFLIIELETVNNFNSGKIVYKGKDIAIGEKVEFYFNKTSIIGQITDLDYSEENSKMEELLVTGVYINIPSYVADMISPGMEIKNPYTDQIYARVENKQVYDSSEHVIYNNSYGSLRFRTDYSLKNVEVKIRLFAEKHLDRYYFSGHQVIRVGEGVTFLFPKVQLGTLRITNVSEVQ